MKTVAIGFVRLDVLMGSQSDAINSSLASNSGHRESINSIKVYNPVFGLIIIDKVHHLPAAGYRNIAEMFASTFRMGLTATFEREDGLHEELNRRMGAKLFEKRAKELTGTPVDKLDVNISGVEVLIGRIGLNVRPDDDHFAAVDLAFARVRCFCLSKASQLSAGWHYSRSGFRHNLSMKCFVIAIYIYQGSSGSGHGRR